MPDSRLDPEPCVDPPPSDGSASPTEAFARIPLLLQELQEYAWHYVAAGASLLGCKTRSFIFGVVLGVLCALVVAALVVAATVLFLVGAGEGLGQALGGRTWLGNLIVGFAALVLTVLGAWMVIGRSRRHARETLVREFEQRKEHQRARFQASTLERSGAVASGLAEAGSSTTARRQD